MKISKQRAAKAKILLLASEPADHIEAAARILLRRYDVYLISPLHSFFNNPAYRRRLSNAGIRLLDGPDMRRLLHRNLLRHAFAAVAIFVRESVQMNALMREVRAFAPHSRIVVFAGTLDLFHRLPRAALSRLFQQEGFALQLLTAYAQADIVITETSEDKDLLLQENPTLRAETVPLLSKPSDRLTLQRLPDLFAGAGPAQEAHAKNDLTSIIILNHNGLQYSKRCIKSIAKYTHKPYELLLIDNGSTDGTAKYLKSVPRATVILNRNNRGFAAGCNQGIRKARGKYLLLLNNDTVVTPLWLDRMIACAQSSRAIGLVGPRTNSIYGVQMTGPGPYRTLADMIRWSRMRHLAHLGDWFEVFALTGFCLLIKREVVKAVGLLDERFAWGPFEDYDYCLRARIAGFRSFCVNDVFIHHYGSKGYAPGVLLDYRKMNRDIFIQKWGKPLYELLQQSLMCSTIGFPTIH